jgi:hypothetical protein
MPATCASASLGADAEERDSDAARNAVGSALPRAVRDARVTMRTTGSRARRAAAPKRDTLRSLRLGAIWTALPSRDQHLLLWLLSADIVTARLAALLVYGQLRIAQRRLSRLVALGVLRGFWAASAQRPRGRFAYGLTRAARLDLERLAWPDGPPDRGPDLLPSVPGHQLATHDLFAAFLTSAAPDVPEGLAVWIPERACGHLFGGFLRPDAVAGIQVGQRALTLFIERDLGTERGEALGQKLRRYDSLFGRIGADGVRVGFVADSPRRGRRFVESAIRQYGTSTPFVTASSDAVIADPLGAMWFDGETHWSTRELAVGSLPPEWQVLAPGCLTDVDGIEALDDRGAALLPALAPYVTTM